MKKLFIHTPIFRIVSPLFVGAVTYLLILLINNNTLQLQEQFLGIELYICMLFSLIIQELSRYLLHLFKKTFLWIKILFITLSSAIVLGCIVFLYYKFTLGYAPVVEELRNFIYVYSFIPITYALLDFSYCYLDEINTQKLENELLVKQNIEEEFKQFKRDINPNLLLESFEMLLILVKENKNLVDDFIDHLAVIYRYILTSKRNQLVSINEELRIVEELIKLYNYLPYRKIKINIEKFDFLVVPASLLFIIEQIIKTTIVSTKIKLEINIEQKGKCFTLSYIPNDKITNSFHKNILKSIFRVYNIYIQNKKL